MKETRRKKGDPPATKPGDLQRVPYKVIRKRFLASYEDSNEVEWLMGVGRYIKAAWMAEELIRADAEDFDEKVTWHVWDEFSEEQIRDFRESGIVNLRRYVDVQHASQWRMLWRAFWKPKQWALIVLRDSRAGVIGGVALIIVVIFIASVWPSLLKWAIDSLTVKPAV